MATSVKKTKTQSKPRSRKATAKSAAAKREKDTPNKRPYWEILAEIGAQIPEEEWAKLHDASINHRSANLTKDKTSKSVAVKPEPTASPKRSFWEVIIELGESIPPSERKKVPRDSSINYKHYLYGAPKQK